MSKEDKLETLLKRTNDIIAKGNTTKFQGTIDVLEKAIHGKNGPNTQKIRNRIRLLKTRKNTANVKSRLEVLRNRQPMSNEEKLKKIETNLTETSLRARLQALKGNTLSPMQPQQQVVEGGNDNGDNNGFSNNGSDNGSSNNGSDNGSSDNGSSGNGPDNGSSGNGPDNGSSDNGNKIPVSARPKHIFKAGDRVRYIGPDEELAGIEGVLREKKSFNNSGKEISQLRVTWDGKQVAEDIDINDIEWIPIPTGLFDKNGKEIFKGAEIKYNEETCIVVDFSINIDRKKSTITIKCGDKKEENVDPTIVEIIGVENDEEDNTRTKVPSPLQREKGSRTLPTNKNSEVSVPDIFRDSKGQEIKVGSIVKHSNSGKEICPGKKQGTVEEIDTERFETNQRPIKVKCSESTSVYYDPSDLLIIQKVEFEEETKPDAEETKTLAETQSTVARGAVLTLPPVLKDIRRVSNEEYETLADKSAPIMIEDPPGVVIAINSKACEAMFDNLQNLGADKAEWSKLLFIEPSEIYSTIADVLPEQICFIIIFNEIFFQAKRTTQSAVKQASTFREKYKLVNTELDKHKTEDEYLTELGTKWSDLEKKYIRDPKRYIPFVTIKDYIISGPKYIQDYFQESLEIMNGVLEKRKDVVVPKGSVSVGPGGPGSVGPGNQ
jgi:hypothetical protein